MRIKTIKFVWNADFSLSGGINALKEVVSGEHSCTLCEIAYHRVRQTKDWKNYKKSLQKKYGCEVREPCRNQLSINEKKHIGLNYPTVLAITDDGFRTLLAGHEIDGCDGDFETFRSKLEQAISTINIGA